MLHRFTNLGLELLDTWRAIPIGQRLTLAVGIIGVTALLTALGGWASAPDYEMLYTDLGEEEAAKAVAALQGEGIPYKLTPNARGVSVPAAQAAQARLKIGGGGIVTQTRQAGFEQLNQNGFGMTEQMQRVNYQRGLEGELARSIRKIDGVDDARVHLVLPAQTLFADRKGEASASVVVSPRGGHQLDDERIQSIVSLVTSSVDSLKPDNVTLVDTKGRVLNDGSTRGSGSRTTSVQYQQQRRIEGDMSGQLTRALERIVGAGNATVKVATTLDWDQVESQREVYEPLPTPGAIRSIRQESESSGTGQQAAGGVPGTSSNVPTYQSAANGSGGQGYERQNNVTNFELNKTIEKTVRAPGSVKRVSVMAVVDDASVPDGVTPEQLQTLLSNAAQLDTKRGDTVVVTRMPFNTAQAQAEAKAMDEAQMKQTMGDAGKSVSFALAPLILVSLAFMALRRGFGGAAPAVAEPSGMRVREVHAELPPVELPSLEEQHAKLRMQQITGLARQEPSAVSALLTTLMEEGRR